MLCFFSLFDFKLPGPRLLSFHFLVFPGGQENHWKGRVLWGSWFGALDWQLMTQRRGVICLEFECFSHGSTVFDCIYLYSNWGETGVKLDLYLNFARVKLGATWPTSRLKYLRFWCDGGHWSWVSENCCRQAYWMGKGAKAVFAEWFFRVSWGICFF